VTESHHPTLATPQEEPELYYLLTDNGANTGVFAEFTTRFIDKLIGPVGSEPTLEGDEELVGFFVKPDGDLIDRPRLTVHVTNFLIAATGGPKQYSGRALEIAHRPGKDGRAPVDPIDDAAFDRFIGLAVETLREMNVPEEWIGLIGGKLEPMRSLVVQA
jgi:truncated hemoglobin YjbI